MTAGTVTSPDTEPRPERAAGRRAGEVALWLLRGRTLIVLILLIIVFSLISPDFLTTVEPDHDDEARLGQRHPRRSG